MCRHEDRSTDIRLGRVRFMNTMIRPNYGTPFDARDLAIYLAERGVGYIVQGQNTCSLANHPEPSSLDVWMRERGDPSLIDRKQADNDVVLQLVRTGLFSQGIFCCPDSGYLCKGVKVVGCGA